MDFQFIQQQTNELILQDITHLQDSLNELGMESPLMFGVSEDMELEQLQSAKQILEEALEEALKQKQLLERPPCHIGPYSGGICTICGLRQP